MTCSTCNGSGKVEYTDYRNIKDVEVCRDCDGKGNKDA